MLRAVLIIRQNKFSDWRGRWLMATLEQRVHAALVKLAGLPWFQASNLKVQNAISNLGPDALGVLEHLANRPTVGGGVELIRLHNFWHPDGTLFGILVNFEVRRLSDGREFRYQYFTWKQGEESGTKGVVVVRSQGKFRGVFCLQGFSFAFGRETFDCVGGFAEVGDIGIDQLTGKIGFTREIQEELGIMPTELYRMIPLGRLMPDRGMTNNRPFIWAAEVDAEVVKHSEGHDNVDPWEMETKVFFVPSDRLWGDDGFLMANEDAFFCAIMAKLVALGVVKP